MRTIIMAGILGLLGWGLAAPVQAAVIETNDWASRTKAGWEYSTNPPYSSPTNNRPVYDPAPAYGCGASPSGGGVIRGTFYGPATPSSSTAGGTSAYVLPSSQQVTTLYYGHWICYSVPFQFHPIGTKTHFMTQRFASGGNVNPSGKDNYVININPGGHGVNVTMQINWDNCTYNPRPNFATQICTRGVGENRGHVEIIPGRWYWMETQATMNTVGNGFSSSHDGILRAWINDILVIEYFDVVFRTTSNNVWNHLANTPILGGGSTWTYNQDQHMLYDHNVISTTRIGMPGGSLPADTTPPGPVTGFMVQ